MRGETVLGHLTYSEGDFPWVTCKFVPTEDFSSIAPLFAEELDLLNQERMEDWEMAYEKLMATGIQMVADTGDETITEFILHIERNEAWFRY